jgi:hypothetical protein
MTAGTFTCATGTAPCSWVSARRRARPSVVRVVRQRASWVEPEQERAGGAYPDCGTCGHNTSAVLAGCCTAFVPLPEGAGALAAYCGCRCVDDPVVRQWLKQS